MSKSFLEGHRERIEARREQEAAALDAEIAERVAAHRAAGCHCTGECQQPGDLDSMGIGFHDD